MLWILVVCFIAVKIDASVIKKETNLIFLQIITRHGDRAPVFKYPNDPNSDYVWPEGIGKLTKLGKKQQLMLGKHIRSMYKNFITSDPNEVNAASSEADRCIRSALALLAGLYEPEPKWIFHESLKWQPIPVTYTPEKEDKILGTSYDCPLAKKEKTKLTLSLDEENKIKYKKMFENLAIKLGMNAMNDTIYSFSNVLHIFDTLIVEKANNLVIPEWAKFYWRDLEEIIDRGFTTLFSSPIVQRLEAGPFIEVITNMMANKTNGQLPQQKVQIYSTHDVTLGTLLSTLGIFNGRRPPYSSTLLIELHEGPKKEHFVRFLYLNSSTPELGEQENHVLKLKGCSELCPFNYLKTFINKKIPVDVVKECKATQ